MKYKFIGNPDNIFPHLKTGEVYDLEFGKLGLIARLLYKIDVLITSPIKCPYETVDSFNSNWQKQKEEK